MDALVHAASSFLGESIVDGVAIGVKHGRIESILDRDLAARRYPMARLVDLGEALLVPGFVDTHVHGGGGGGFNDADVDEIAGIAEAHASRGTTSLVATLLTDTPERTLRAVTAIEQATRDAVSARILGSNLEGPCLASEMCGAHEPSLLVKPAEFDYGRVRQAAKGTLRAFTIAPELEGGLDLISDLRRDGVSVRIGHTSADAEMTMRAISVGANGATHLFNAMTPMHHRAPGAAVVLLMDDRVTLELIGDGCHVDPEIARLVYALAKERTVLVSDSLACGAEPGAHVRIGPLSAVVHEDGTCRAPDGTALFGSALPLSASVARLASRIELRHLLHSATWLPAVSVGARHVGRIAPDFHADLVALDPETLAPLWVSLGGNEIPVGT